MDGTIFEVLSWVCLKRNKKTFRTLLLLRKETHHSEAMELLSVYHLALAALHRVLRIGALIGMLFHVGIVWMYG